jgi:uncharacterized repeat protein (TIGR03843 family)
VKADGLTSMQLESGELTVVGRLAAASNATLKCEIERLACVYKPVRGERPLWDFPEWTLGHRELAAYELAQALGWELVPTTVWRTDGPLGPGMCQAWIEDPTDSDRSPIAVVPEGAIPEGYVHVLDAEDGAGNAVALVHEDAVDLARIAAFDILANNADRKAGHVIVGQGRRLWAIDHGVTFAVEPKLRSVLWGWIGEPVPETILADVSSLADALADGLDPVDRWLAEQERAALRERVHHLLRTAVFPEPSGQWPAIPWPVF